MSYSHWSVIWVFLMLYGVSLISMGFMVSTWCDTSSATAAGTTVFVFIMYLPFSFIQQDIEGIPYIIKQLLSLSSPVAMSLGCTIISSWESRAIGLQWNNVWDRVSASDQTTMGSIFMLLIVDSLLYYIFARYVDLVKPGQWGAALPWNFCFMKSYWRPQVDASTSRAVLTNESAALSEPLPAGYRAGFRLFNATKSFMDKKERKIAVNNLSFVALEDQITVLLGHNGAGKSTTMNMLSGMLCVDSGECFVGLHDVKNNLSAARQTLGLCPQQNILIAEMTVREHLRFFAQLKGSTRKQANEEIETLADDIQLRDKIDIAAGTLSGGMKRKLSLGIALCANSKHLILDEPSSGVDVRARRELWTILQKYRKNRTMLISTHYMDEAEALADRIVIIGKGQLKCEGTTSFLKTTLGQGYHLNLSLEQNFNLSKIEDFVKQSIPDARLENNYGTEVKFLLPFASINHFTALFRSIDQSGSSIGIDNYGASITTMDEIFQNITKDCTADDADETMMENKEEILQKLAKRTKLLTGYQLRMQQFRGAFSKCFLHAIRNVKMILFQLAMPTFHVIVAVLLIKSIPEIGDQPALDLSLNRYQAPFPEDLTLTTFTSANATFTNVIERSIHQETLLENVTGNLSTIIPNRISDDISHFNDKYLLALQISQTPSNIKFKSYFNGDAFHSIASSVLYTDRMVLNHYFSSLDGIGINTINHPLPANSTESMKKNTNFFIQGFLISLWVTVGMMLVFGAFVALPVKERFCGVKTLQRCSGAPVWLSWMAQYTWDLLGVQ